MGQELNILSSCFQWSCNICDDLVDVSSAETTVNEGDRGP